MESEASKDLEFVELMAETAETVMGLLQKAD